MAAFFMFGVCVLCGLLFERWKLLNFHPPPLNLPLHCSIPHTSMGAHTALMSMHVFLFLSFSVHTMLLYEPQYPLRGFLIPAISSLKIAVISSLHVSTNRDIFLCEI